MANWGLLLVNLGTPDAPETSAVRRYLRQFLSDPRVLDIHPLKRALILNLFILPSRPQKSAEAYRKIWTARGSPLLFHGLDLRDQVRRLLGAGVPVEFGMRYQSPSIARALRALRDQGADAVVVFPLFPQYSTSAWGSAAEEVFEQAKRFWNVACVQFVPPFYEHPAFLDAFAAVARPVLEEFRPDRALMSFHGLPERQIRKSDESGGGHCLRTESCCERIGRENRHCYRAQCFATARGLASRLGLDAGGDAVAFQSRLGRDPWIQPYTDEVVVAWARAGVRRLAVFCPAFVADCLETLEEIGIRARDDFIANGGEDLRLVPSLNSEDVWAEAVVRLAREQSGLGASPALASRSAAGG
jgi:ferrochelatase